MALTGRGWAYGLHTARTAFRHGSSAARDLAELLPLTLDLEDVHRTERIGYPPRELDTSGAPEAAKPRVGDLAYYSP
ncbi:cyclophilin-like fold protein [Streptomyces sp. NPDC049915]|uniref:cyclophilin-like fold protein n=1 Tax=Streptomyces sp. NPDC049915 TaxID=3155510 RepID=UPI00343F620B